MTKEPFGTTQILLALFAPLRGDFSHAENMMAGSCPMCGAMGWGGMILGAALAAAIIATLIALTVFLIRRSRHSGTRT